MVTEAGAVIGIMSHCGPPTVGILYIEVIRQILENPSPPVFASRCPLPK